MILISFVQQFMKNKKQYVNVVYLFRKIYVRGNAKVVQFEPTEISRLYGKFRKYLEKKYRKGI
jgi:hypothetical protein